MLFSRIFHQGACLFCFPSSYGQGRLSSTLLRAGAVRRNCARPYQLRDARDIPDRTRASAPASPDRKSRVRHSTNDSVFPLRRISSRCWCPLRCFHRGSHTEMLRLSERSTPGAGRENESLSRPGRCECPESTRTQQTAWRRSQSAQCTPRK